MIRRFVFLLAMIVLSRAALGATEGGAVTVPLPLFPTNNWWNTDVSAAPVDANTANFINFLDPLTPLHPDFGGDVGDGTVYGFPFIQVDGSQPKKTVTFNFASESDGVDHNTNQPFPFYPIPDEAITMSGWVEGGHPGNIDDRSTEDRHVLMLDTTNNTLYELYNVWFNGTNWQAGSGAFFDMNTNNRRPDTWTSADAAGLAILPGLVRYDEVAGPNEINHAFRFTVLQSNGYVYPASHNAGATAGALPMGARLRLKASKDISSYAADVQKIFRAFKKYGLIVADNGTNMYISGTYDTRWNTDVLNPAFNSLKAGDFEVVQQGWAPSISFVLTLPAAMGAGDAADGTMTAYDSNDNVATGYRGTVHFTSTDGAATLPLNYTFTSADAGTHTFTGGFTMRTAGTQTVTATDIADATITGFRIVSVGPPTPAGLNATATPPSRVDLSWNPSVGAAQYQILRASASSGYAPIATIAATSTSYQDNSVIAGATYVYRVRAIDASLRNSPLSAPDAATVIAFTDDPVLANVTSIKAVHVTELRQAVNAMRAAGGLALTSFTDSTLTTIEALHVQELRGALTQARAALGLTTPVYTDSTLAANVTLVRAVHIQELRNGVK